MKKERLFYLDFVRAIAVISIVMTHFNARYLYLNPPAFEKAILTTNVGNLYIGDWGVSLFFVISGAALMYVYQQKCELKTFYKKRFLSIFPMFWMAYVVAFLLAMVQTHAFPGGGIPKWRLIFSAIGFDGLLLTNGFPTFYLLGEWFLGVIILIYVVFPLLRKLMNEHPYLLAVLTIGCYVAGFAIGKALPHPIVPATNILIRIPELVFGMYFVKWHTNLKEEGNPFIQKNGKIAWYIALAAAVVVLGNWIVKPQISASVQTTYVGIASFLVLVFLSNYLRCSAVEWVCGKLSKYSYAIFLVHHVIIGNVMGRVNLVEISVVKSYLLFAVICVLIGVCAWVLFVVHKNIMKFITRLISKPDIA